MLLRTVSINIDIDNTVNNFIQEFTRLVNGMNKNKLHSDKKFSVSDIDCYFLQDATGIQDDVLQTLFFRNDEFYRQLKPLPDCVRVIKNLVCAGHDVKFVSAVNYEAIQSRLDFVREHFPFMDVDRSLIITNDKSSILADIVIDDCLANIGNNKNSCCSYIVFDQAWNKAIDANTCTRAKSWAEVEQILTAWEVL